MKQAYRCVEDIDIKGTDFECQHFNEGQVYMFDLDEKGRLTNESGYLYKKYSKYFKLIKVIPNPDQTKQTMEEAKDD